MFCQILLVCLIQILSAYGVRNGNRERFRNINRFTQNEEYSDNRPIFQVTDGLVQELVYTTSRWNKNDPGLTFLGPVTQLLDATNKDLIPGYQTLYSAYDISDGSPRDINRRYHDTANRENRIAKLPRRFQYACKNNEIQTTAYYCIETEYKKDPKICSTRKNGKETDFAPNLLQSFKTECLHLIKCKNNADLINKTIKYNSAEQKKAKNKQNLKVVPEKLPECLQCGKGQVDEKLKGCSVAPHGKKSYNEQCDNYRTDVKLVTQCRGFVPDCTNLGLYSKHSLCIACDVTNKKDKCENVDCTENGKDRGTDICEKYQFDCKNTKFKAEDACLDCEIVDKENQKCKNRKCYRGAPDKHLDICLGWKPDCAVAAHKKEDLCLDCLDKDKAEKACKKKDGRDWDCIDKDKSKEICYYSTTTTPATTQGDLELDDAGPNAGHGGSGFANETSKFLGERHKEDYLTTISVPTFLVISILAAILFILMHMPVCCFGICREPDWEEYGQPKYSSDDERA